MAYNQLKTKFPLLFLSILTIVFVLLFTLHYLKIFNLQEWLYPGYNSSNSQNFDKNQNLSDKKIIKVGREDIYQSDLDYELMNYPFKNNDTEKILIDKIIMDSVIIQSAQKDGLIKLDKSVFNSPLKDYIKRTELVKNIKRMIDNRSETVSGYIISIWFNNKYPGKVGLEKGREIALNKISAIHSSVQNGQVSILQAAQRIIDDKSLAEVDPDYQVNAISAFEVSPDEKITRDADFDKYIRSLDVGQLSDVYAVKDRASGFEEQVETSYMFAQVTQRKNKGRSQDFEKWYSDNKNKYDITNY